VVEAPSLARHLRPTRLDHDHAQIRVLVEISPLMRSPKAIVLNVVHASQHAPTKSVLRNPPEIQGWQAALSPVQTEGTQSQLARQSAEPGGRKER
jgi:hypothetical protein